MLHRLLVPLDGSPSAEAVLPMAAYLAQRANAGVMLLHLIEHHAPATVHGQRHLTSAAEAENYLADVARRCFPPTAGVVWHVHDREINDVAHGLADHAGELECELVVMLSHGQWDFHRWLSGNLAQKAVRQAPSPILLLRAGPDGTIPVPFRQLLVPLDGRPEHESGMPAAVELARLCAAPMRLLMVVPTLATLRGEDAAAGQLLPAATREMLDLAQREGTEYLQRHLLRARAEGIEATAAIARGEPATMIAEAAHDLKADLVVLSTHGSAGVEAFWTGSLGQRLIAKLPASFLLAAAGSG
jgi:nucleotide-binding universal stress UspA family protein